MAADPKNKIPTTRWEEHVENAILHPLAIGILRMVEMILM
jgi:hypothetical protein